MKRFIVFDFALQSLLFMVAMYAFVAFLAGYQDHLLLLLVVQLLTGCLQLFSAMVHIIASSPEKKLRRIHIVLSVICLLMVLMIVRKPDPTEPAVYCFINGMAWAPGILYYIITFRLLFPKRVSGSGFLPHLSF